MIIDGWAADLTLGATVAGRRVLAISGSRSRSPRRRPISIGMRASGSDASATAADDEVAPQAGLDRAVMRVARQPILDLNARLVGYELLFREPLADEAGVLDDREATATVIVDGLLGVFDLVGESVAYLNVSRDFLLTLRPLPLPAGRVVLELLEGSGRRRGAARGARGAGRAGLHDRAR